MKELLEHIESVKETYARLQPLSAENQQRLDKKFRLEWNFNSNHIEGNTLTYGETELLLIQGDTKGQHEVREFDEMRGHDIALKLIQDLAADKERYLTEVFIREINKIILKEPFYKEAITPDGQPTRRLIKIGEYKSFPNSVRLQNGEIFHYPSPQQTPALMSDLLAWYHNTSKNSTPHPVEVAAELHYRFVYIHPFDDGNGRIARLLMNYHLLKNGYPPVIIKSADKKNYLFALHEADIGNLEALKTYVAEQLLWSYEISIKAAEGEGIDEAGDWEKKVEVLKKEVKAKKELTIKKNRVIIEQIIDKEVIVLFEAIKDKLFKLEDLFFSKKIHIAFGQSKWQIVNSEQIKNKVKDFVHDSTDMFYFSILLLKYKYKEFTSFDVVKTVFFDFNEFYYEIAFGNNDDESAKIRKHYSELLTENEIFNIVEFVANSALDDIDKNKKG